MLGKAKRGKSTLINALLGRGDDTLAPIDKLPASSAISRFAWAENELAEVTFRDGRKESIPVGRIREFVTEEFNKENQKGVVVVDVACPFAGLERDLVLVDTPGASSIHEHHDALLQAFIPQADAVVFLVTATMPVDQDELELLTKIKQADIQKLFFVMNKVDQLADQDVQDAVSHNLALLNRAGIPATQIHLVSAKRAYQGELGESGLPDLKAEIARFLAAHSGRVLRERFVSRVRGQANPVLLSLGLELSGYRKSTAELDTDLGSLQAKKSALEADRVLAERVFKSDWNKAIEQFEQGLNDARQETTVEIADKIAQTSVLEVSKLAQNLPTELNRVIEDRLAGIARSLEQALRDASDRLNASYPALSVGKTGTLEIRTKDSSVLAVGLLGGGVAAAAGVGVAVAGSTVAASIAAANAAALAATTSVAAPSIVSGLLTFAGLEALAPLATGTATVAAPAALTATPVWVALAGPVGWTLAGVGLMAVPFAWRVSKLKLKDKLDEASRQQVRLVFDRLQDERIPALRKLGTAITEEFRIKLDRELNQIESAILQARDHRPSESDVRQLEHLAQRLGALLQAGLGELSE